MAKHKSNNEELNNLKDVLANKREQLETTENNNTIIYCDQHTKNAYIAGLRQGIYVLEQEILKIEKQEKTIAPPDNALINIGDIVDVSINGKPYTVRIVHVHLPPNPGIHQVTPSSPLGTAIIGEKPGHTCSYKVKGNLVEVKILGKRSPEPTSKEKCPKDDNYR